MRIRRRVTVLALSVCLSVFYHSSGDVVNFYYDQTRIQLSFNFVFICNSCILSHSSQGMALFAYCDRPRRCYSRPVSLFSDGRGFFSCTKAKGTLNAAKMLACVGQPASYIEAMPSFANFRILFRHTNLYACALVVSAVEHKSSDVRDLLLLHNTLLKPKNLYNYDGNILTWRQKPYGQLTAAQAIPQTFSC